MNQPAVTKIVSVLMERGWLIAETDSVDARKKWLKMTPEGLGTVIKAYGLLTPVIDSACEGLSDEEVETLQMLLERFNHS